MNRQYRNADVEHAFCLYFRLAICLKSFTVNIQIKMQRTLAFPTERFEVAVGIEWDSDEIPHATPVTGFDYGSLDDFETVARDALARGNGDFVELLAGWAREQQREQRREGMERLIALLWPKRKTYLALRQLAFAVGLAILGGQNASALARECGVSKQDFHEGANRFRAQLGLRKTRTARSQDGCDRMRLTNYARTPKR
jgi:hypothetical protein